VHPVMPTMGTKTGEWRIKDDETKVELWLFHLPEKAKPGDFHVGIEGNVLVVRAKWEQPDEDISFQVRLHVPELYNKNGIAPRLQQHRHLMVIIPKQDAPAVPCQKFNVVVETNE
jgi:hypothetical protein